MSARAPNAGPELAMPGGVPASRASAPGAGGWRSDAFATEDDAPRRLPHLLLFLVVAFVVFAIGWASVSELDEVTRGEARVITSSQVQLVQNLEGGILAEILVKEGDRVEKDQTLFRLDPTRFVSAMREGEQQRIALEAKIARLSAEATGGRIQMPPAVTKANPVLARQEIAAFESRARDLASKSDILREQLAQRRSELVELQAREARLKESLALIEKEIGITSPLVNQGVVSEVELLRLQRERARIRTDLDGATLAIPRVRASIDEARRRIDETTTSFRAQAAAELSTARAELDKVSETTPALEDRVTRTAVRAPMDGIVKTILNRTVGGVVQPGSALAEVVPEEENLLIETRVRPADIAFISEGQRAVVKISAYDYSIYGGLDGKIVLVGADSIQPQQGEPYYIVHVRTDRSAIAFGGRSLPVIPGMTASVDIVTGKKTVLDYLLKPVNKARERALRER